MLIKSIIVSSAFTIAAVVILVLCLVNNREKESTYYPDLSTQEASTCWETTVFSAKNDPLYQWTTTSSIADSFNGTVDPERATAAYQRASVWRLPSREKKCSTNCDYKLFNSPDPHVLGGRILQHKTNWIWKMDIDWGLSVRVCLTGPATLVTCAWTASAIKHPNNSAVGILMVNVPFRKPSYSYDQVPDYGNGTFLMNYASNARRNLSLGVERKFNKSEDGFTYNYFAPPGLNICSRLAPVFYIPDIVSYMAFPFLQCACAPGVCIFGRNLTGKDNETAFGQFKINSEECISPKSLWDYRSITKGNNYSSIYLSTYSSKWDDTATMSVFFSYPAFFTYPSGYTLETMRNVSLCVERWLENQKKKPEGEDDQNLRENCNSGGYYNNTTVLIDRRIPSDSMFLRLESALGYGSALKDLVSNRVTIQQEQDSVTCGFEEGQANESREICFMEYPLIQDLNERLKSFAKVTDIHRFGTDLWEKGSAERSGVYLGILSTLVTLIVTVYGMTSKKLQDGEDMVLKYLPMLQRITNWFGEANARTLFRTGIILSTTGTVLLNLWWSIRGIGMDRQLATSGTIPQQMPNQVVVLVTTTSTVEVKPNWIVFYVFSAVLGATVVAIIVFIYSQMQKIKPISQGRPRGKERMEPLHPKPASQEEGGEEMKPLGV